MDKIVWIQTEFEKIKQIFLYNQKVELDSIQAIAQLIKKNINSIDLFIQQNTSVVCRQCQKVCCVNKHGYYELEDLLYLNAINEKLPLYKEQVDDDEPCQFLSSSGCTIDRYKRPFRCNWYFCVPLITYMQTQRGKDYRMFENQLQQIVDYRKLMTDIYNKVFADD
ncbi:MAG: hypothetical protein N2738_05550 [Thermodesulfovibrionales bacterium]|nr:hypothetical protein [Thermodesulfovibrionales bacterium]